MLDHPIIGDDSTAVTGPLTSRTRRSDRSCTS